jgi:hypothetical protein
LKKSPVSAGFGDFGGSPSPYLRPVTDRSRWAKIAEWAFCAFFSGNILPLLVFCKKLTFPRQVLLARAFQ